MPVAKFDRSMVKLIAEEAGLTEPAVWVSMPEAPDAKVRIFFWTEKMTSKEFKRLTSAGAANFRGSHGGGRTHRQKVISFLEGFNAEGWLTRVNPREALPKDLHRLSGPKEWCELCGSKLLAPEEEFVGQCDSCCSYDE